MWQPTHVQVTVQRAKGLLYKGKNDSNDAFVVIALGKEKFQTSVKERSSNPVEWHEECDLEIPSHGNTASVQLTVYHRNGLGMDEFLGQITLPLNDFDVYERPRTKLYKLLGKPDKNRKKAEKERGELEAKIAFIVKSGNFLDVAKKDKHKSSLTSLKNIGGSLLSLGNKEKQGLKKFTKSVSSRMDKIVPKKKRSNTRSTDEFPPSQLMASSQWAGQADPGVISDEEDDLAFDDVKVSSTVSSSPYSVSSRASSRHLTGQHLPEDERSLSGVGPEYPGPDTGHNHHQQQSERGGPHGVGSLEQLSGGGGSSRSSLNNSCASSTHDLQHQHLDHQHAGSPRFPEVKALTLERGSKLSPFEESPDSAKKQKRKGLKSRLFSKGHSGGRVEEEGRVVEGGNDRLPNAPASHPHSRISQDIHNKFAGKSREDLMEQIVVLQSMMERQVRHTRDLEEYIDNLLLRVLDASPHILQAPTTPQLSSGGMHRSTAKGRMS